MKSVYTNNLQREGMGWPEGGAVPRVCSFCKGRGFIFGITNGGTATEPCAICNGTERETPFPPIKPTTTMTPSQPAQEAEIKFPYPPYKGKLDNAEDMSNHMEVCREIDRKRYAFVQAQSPAALREPEQGVKEVWDAALTLANNLCVQISDEYNNDDEIEKADVANKCAKQIRAEIGQMNYYLSTPPAGEKDMWCISCKQVVESEKILTMAGYVEGAAVSKRCPVCQVILVAIPEQPAGEPQAEWREREVINGKSGRWMWHPTFNNGNPACIFILDEQPSPIKP